MKLLKPDEVKALKESELSKDLARTEATKNALKAAQTDLSTVEAKFEVALANQHVTWAKEEEEHNSKIVALTDEIKKLEAKRDSLLIPIEEREKKSHDLLVSAEATYQEASVAKQKADTVLLDNERMSDLLTEKLDEVGERELSLKEWENKLELWQKSQDAEREQIKKLSQELTNNLSKL